MHITAISIAILAGSGLAAEDGKGEKQILKRVARDYGSSSYADDYGKYLSFQTKSSIVFALSNRVTSLTGYKKTINQSKFLKIYPVVIRLLNENAIKILFNL